METRQIKIPIYAEDVESAYDEIKEFYPLALARRIDNNDHEIVFFNGEGSKKIAVLTKNGRKPILNWMNNRPTALLDHEGDESI
jgi:hypothetical protein